MARDAITARAGAKSAPDDIAIIRRAFETTRTLSALGPVLPTPTHMRLAPAAMKPEGGVGAGFGHGFDQPDVALRFARRCTRWVGMEIAD
jgi:hypothetical protein